MLPTMSLHIKSGCAATGNAKLDFLFKVVTARLPHWKGGGFLYKMLDRSSPSLGDTIKEHIHRARL